MPIVKRNTADVLACLLIACFGIAVIILGFGYRMGTLTRMGPGFFAVATGAFLVMLAVASALEASRMEEVHPVFKLRPVLFVCLAILVWTMTVESLGIIPSTIALVGISSLSRSPFRPLSLLVLAAGLCLLGYFVFIELGMPLTMLGR